jgi:hypothetical protein
MLNRQLVKQRPKSRALAVLATSSAVSSEVELPLVELLMTRLPLARARRAVSPVLTWAPFLPV